MGEYNYGLSKWSCLLNIPDGVGDIALNATLQTSFTMDEQCRMEFGNGYSMCKAFEIIEPCSHLWCGHQNSPLVCKTKKGPPLEGTECGFGKWCINGYCEEVGNRRFERVPVVLNPQDGGWGDWAPWGVCSRTCGTGVQFKSRKCNNPEPSYGGKHCIGEPEEWRLCNRNPCPDTSADIRAQQCKHLPKILHLELEPEANFTWLPYEIEKKCKYICVSAERKELHIADENLIDGTPCSYENPDNICVQGKCQVVGCDGKLNSQLQRDRCGTCGGNNSNCSEIRFSFDRKLKESGRSAAEDGERDKSGNQLTIPNTVVHTKIIEGTKFSYKKVDNRHNIWTKGPLNAEMVILIVVPKIHVGLGINITYRMEYSIHKDFLAPSKRFTWIMGGWGPCSASCGRGRRQKTVACWDNTNNKCNFQWIAGEWEPCTTSCGINGIQSRELYCVPNSVLNEMLFKNNGTIIKYPWIHMVNPKKCSGLKPTSVRECNRQACFSYWTFGDVLLHAAQVFKPELPVAFLLEKKHFIPVVKHPLHRNVCVLETTQDTLTRYVVVGRNRNVPKIGQSTVHLSIFINIVNSADFGGSVAKHVQPIYLQLHIIYTLILTLIRFSKCQLIKYYYNSLVLFMKPYEI
ncbi:hypothetical protein NQ317_010537 [Molorchus minor]|uniref:Uncharacterized protein n=1 Tax=Molorchus minor TaxID=1323400 RepID=A0ABQ9K128_9CUCU|nr:hypothetical protein NQ317_010537 [Molorchus minor]